jgi:hypothetical protein
MTTSASKWHCIDEAPPHAITTITTTTAKWQHKNSNKNATTASTWQHQQANDVSLMKHRGHHNN